MSITIELPAQLEAELRATSPNLDSVAKEATLVALYQQGRLLHTQLADLLGLDRWQTEALLRRYGMSDLTEDEISRQIQAAVRGGS